MMRTSIENVSYCKLPASCVEHAESGVVQVWKVSVQPGGGISHCRSHDMPTARWGTLWLLLSHLLPAATSQCNSQ